MRTLAICLVTTLLSAQEPLPLMETVTVGSTELKTKELPKGIVLREGIGLITASAVKGQVVHRTQTRVLETRATITPKGDYLLMFPEGDHYAKSKGEKINSMMACRSSDHGKTWSKPAIAYDVPYGQHGFVPLIPHGAQRIYCFGTQPVPGKWTWENGQRENAPIGYRCSDDDGHTWSETKLIAPVNDPGFMGMSVMRMTETDAGTWLIGSHLADWSVKPFTTQQYILRSEDKGATWTVLPGARPNGWAAEGFNRMDEGRPLNLGGGRVLFMSRTPQGHLFTAWSSDDGKTWTKPAPSTLVHPDAPPMVFQLSDGKTLVAFHHNKVPSTKYGELSDKAETMKMRSEVWASLSTDEGHTWSAPRFVLANAVAPIHAVSGFNSQCSYIDAFTDDGVLHLFMPHRWQQVLHLTLREDALTHLPSQVFIKKLAAQKPETKQPIFTSELSAKVEPTRRVIYKKIGDRELGLDIFEPAGFKPNDKRACFVSIHGGGWTSGSPRSMYVFADHCAKLGMVSVAVQYRLYKTDTDVSVFECVKDARAAVRYVRAHAEELGIDSHKIIVNGASAGGHLAAATAMFDGVDHADEDLRVSCRPDALVLFSPVIDTSSEGYGNAKIGERWQELSPAHQVKPNMPPTLHFHGDGDTTTPILGVRLFVEAMLKAGNRIEFVSPPGAIHTFMFKDKALYEDTLKRMDAFFDSLGFFRAQAALRLPAFISDHMVLQAGKPATIWGRTIAGDTIKVEFAGQSRSTTSNAKGEWQVKLDPMPASEKPGELRISSSNPKSEIRNLKCEDVLVGEVWLASGQSNMEMQIKGKMHGKVDNADAVIAEAKHPQIRFFVHDAPFAIYELPVPPDEPLADRAGKWIVCSPETVADFTAMGYFVARDIMNAVHTPVGILSASVGGTPIEAWTSIEPQQRVPSLKPLLDDWTKRLDGLDPAKEQSAFLEKKSAWLKQRAAALKANQPAPKAPSPFKNIGVMKPGRLFNGVIAPLVPYTVRGCLWYQGERNANGPFTGLYGEQMKTLITDWRAQWHDDFYFAWVQLPAFATPQKLPSEPTGWGVSVREGQMQALALPHTGMAITMDIGDPKQGHPTNKADFAARLSRVVLHDVYRQDIAIWSGPVFKSVEFNGGKAWLTFDHGKGLKAKSGALEGFAIAGEDKKFVWADAKIEGEHVIVSNADIPTPKAVRYAWASNPKGNLINAADLPASPFRTDTWK
ncbi:MAG: exo-alpha-sialidase [Verrucomicrobiaceae bacterium]|nr:exo-alpha-sialidase [Verrucomicrobiaceae bacterium]